MTQPDSDRELRNAISAQLYGMYYYELPNNMADAKNIVERAAKVAAAYQATVQPDNNVFNTCSTSGQLNMSQPDSDLRLQIAEDLISLPIGKNKPLFWDLDTLVDYIAIAQTKLVEELLGDLPDMKEVVTPIKPGINGYNLALAEVTALLKAKLTKG